MRGWNGVLNIAMTVVTCLLIAVEASEGLIAGIALLCFLSVVIVVAL